MTYCEDLDPNNPYVAAAQAAAEMWDDFCPEWREMTTEPEDRVMVDYNDVRDPDSEGIVRYGSNHARLVPAAY